MAALINDPVEANRLARTIASDIRLYNRAVIAEGLEHDDLFIRLDAQIKEAHAHFDARVDPALRAENNFVERALVDVLIQRSAGAKTDCW